MSVRSRRNIEDHIERTGYDHRADYPRINFGGAEDEEFGCEMSKGD